LLEDTASLNLIVDTVRSKTEVKQIITPFLLTRTIICKRETSYCSALCLNSQNHRRRNQDLRLAMISPPAVE